MASTSWAATAPIPKVTGFWPGTGAANSFIFVFGAGFAPNQTQVSVNGISASLAQVLDASLLIFVLPLGDTAGIITVATPGGTASSSTPFGVPLTGLTITGLWPGEGPVNTVVFVFGSGFVANQTQASLNGISAPLVQTLDPTLLLFVVPPGATTGTVTITTPVTSTTSTAVFVVTP